MEIMVMKKCLCLKGRIARPALPQINHEEFNPDSLAHWLFCFYCPEDSCLLAYYRPGNVHQSWSGNYQASLPVMGSILLVYLFSKGERGDTNSFQSQRKKLLSLLMSPVKQTATTTNTCFILEQLRYWMVRKKIKRHYDLVKSKFLSELGICFLIIFWETTSLKPIMYPSQREKAIRKKTTIPNIYRLLNEIVLY